MHTAIAEPTTRPLPGEQAIVDLDRICTDPSQPRVDFESPAAAEALRDLTNDIRQRGVLEPLLVNKMEGSTGYFMIIAGERRFRAALKAGLREVPCVIFNLTSPAEILEMQLVENVLRRPMHPIEEAVAYQRLVETNPAYRDLDALAARVSQSVTTVRNRLKFLDLIPEAQAAFRRNEITDGHALVIARLAPSDQARALEACFETFELLAATDEERDGETPRRLLAVRELEDWVRTHLRQDRQVLQQTMPELDAAIAEQETAGHKVVEISLMHRHELPRDVDRKALRRVLFAGQWKDATVGTRGKVCAYAVLGVITHGPNAGQQRQVCANKKQCRDHWPITESRHPGITEGDDRRAREQEEYQRAEDERQAWERDRPAAIARAKTAAPAILNRGAFEVIYRALSRNASDVRIPQAKPSEFVPFLVELAAGYAWNRASFLAHVAKPLGTHIIGIGSAAPAPTTKRAPAPKKKPKAKAKPAPRAKAARRRR